MQRDIEVLGVRARDATVDEALELLGEMIERGEATGRTRCVYFINAHTLNWASSDEEYRRVLNAADVVFGDGTGVRWAARMRGVEVQANLNGTDLTPALLRRYSDRRWRYFLLGSPPPIVARAAERCTRDIAAGWILSGYHHGYLHGVDEDALIRRINEKRPHVLLVGMGNPLQELWIHRHRRSLRVPIAMGVGGLFHFWSGDAPRAPTWLRAAGLEWVHVMLAKPRKAPRYLLGNPRFLWRAVQHSRLRGAFAPCP